MGRSHLVPELFNCSAPDTGNMEVLARYGTREHQERWLKALLSGEIRSCFAMTEPAVASSDATNVESSIVRDGEYYVINGRKWYTTNDTDPRCKICIFMVKTDPDNPNRHPDRASEVVFSNVRVPATNMLLGEGRGSTYFRPLLPISVNFDRHLSSQCFAKRGQTGPRYH